MREIAAILSKAAIIYLRKQDRERMRDPKPIQARAEVWDLVDDEVEKRVLRYISVHVVASPRDIEQALGIPHVTLARRLSRLRAAGIIHASGRTRGAQYCLAAHKGTN